MIPAVKRPTRLRLPPHTDTRLRNGLRVLALRKPIVPRVEFRLRIPAGRAQDGSASGARAMLLADALFAGTSTRSARDLAEAIQGYGATIDVACGPDDITIRGGVLKEHLRPLLDLVVETVTDAAFPAREVEIAADRLAQAIEIGRNQAQSLAAEAVMGRAFGRHRYGRPQPDPARVRALRSGALRTYAREGLSPRGASIVLVGDLHPDRAVELVTDVFGPWRLKAVARYDRAASPVGNPRLLVVDRPDSVQTNIRLLFPGLDRNDPAHLPLVLGETILSGYFTSRLVRNIRETRGYCYTVGSRLEVRRLASMVHLAAPVGAEVTAPALREIRYEMVRMVTEMVEPEELQAAKSFLSGQALIAMLTQIELAGVADQLLAEGCDLSYLENYAPRLHAVTPEEILVTAQRYLAPIATSTVLVGDLNLIRASLDVTDDLEVATPTD